MRAVIGFLMLLEYTQGSSIHVKPHQETLYDLFIALNFNSSNSRPLHNWFLDDSNDEDDYEYCSFTGVTCNDEKEVVQLKLDHLQLSGTIPQLQSFSSTLQDFQLHTNFIAGTIPSFQNWDKLLHLNLGQNQFVGQIPPFNSSLRRLILADNDLTGSVPSSLCNLPDLLTLDLSSNLQLNGVLPSCLGDLLWLRSIQVMNCSITEASWCDWKQTSNGPNNCNVVGCPPGFYHYDQGNNIYNDTTITTDICKLCKTPSNVIASSTCRILESPSTVPSDAPSLLPTDFPTLLYIPSEPPTQIMAANSSAVSSGAPTPTPTLLSTTTTTPSMTQFMDQRTSMSPTSSPSSYPTAAVPTASPSEAVPVTQTPTFFATSSFTSIPTFTPTILINESSAATANAIEANSKNTSYNNGKKRRKGLIAILPFVVLGVVLFAWKKRKDHVILKPQLLQEMDDTDSVHDECEQQQIGLGDSKSDWEIDWIENSLVPGLDPPSAIPAPAPRTTIATTLRVTQHREDQQKGGLAQPPPPPLAAAPSALQAQQQQQRHQLQQRASEQHLCIVRPRTLSKTPSKVRFRLPAIALSYSSSSSSSSSFASASEYLEKESTVLESNGTKRNNNTFQSMLHSMVHENSWMIDTAARCTQCSTGDDIVENQTLKRVKHQSLTNNPTRCDHKNMKTDNSVVHESLPAAPKVQKSAWRTRRNIYLEHDRDDDDDEYDDNDEEYWNLHTVLRTRRKKCLTIQEDEQWDGPISYQRTVNGQGVLGIRKQTPRQRHRTAQDGNDGVFIVEVNSSGQQQEFAGLEIEV